MNDPVHIFTNICPFLNSENFPYRFSVEVFPSKQRIFEFYINSLLSKLIYLRKNKRINKYINSHYNQYISFLSIAGFEREINELLQIENNIHDIWTEIKIKDALLDIFPFEEQARVPITMKVRYFEKLKWASEDYESKYLIRLSINSNSKTIFKFNDRNVIINVNSISKSEFIPFLVLVTNIDPQIANLVDKKSIINDLHKYFYEPNFKFVYILYTYPRICPNQQNFIKKDEAVKIRKSERKYPLIKYFIPSGNNPYIESFEEEYKLNNDNIVIAFVYDTNIVYLFSNEEIRKFNSFFDCEKIELKTKIRREDL
jgi:hypothetical protein